MYVSWISTKSFETKSLNLEALYVYVSLWGRIDACSLNSYILLLVH